MNVPLDQLISWGLTVVVLTLFLVERKKNVKEPIFMTLQGYLQSTFVKYRNHKAHFGFLAHAKNSGVDRIVTLDEYVLYAQSVMSDYEAQMANILGAMKSLGIENERIFDINDFTGEREQQAEWESKIQKIIESQK